ncbi:MAG: phosphomannomutase/phosphoglucomutase [Acidimicrobiia bacterium]
MADLDAIFKAYDVRGITPDQLDPEVAHAIGSAFARFVAGQVGGARRVVLARDMRASGVELSAAFAEGVQGQGLDVVDLGLASTDLLYFAAGKLDAPGVMFTASHNPAQYNGMKMCLPGARPIGEESGLGEIKAMAASGVVPAEGPRGGYERLDLLRDFAAHVQSFVDTSSLRPLKVVADTANGMGGLVVPAVFAGLPIDLEVMYGELDGSFPNHPADPIQAENLRDLQARVVETGADVGLAFDGDADRVFLVDDKAQPVSGSTTTAMVAKAVLEKNPGSAVIYNLICSKSVPEIIEENGGRPVRTRVGHSFIKAVMADTDAVFGGEHSGHYYFRDNYRADSGLIASMFVLEQLSRAAEPLSELRKPFERYAMSGERNVEVDDPKAVIDEVAQAFPDADADRTDGLTLDFGDWWVNLRPSNTEPLLRINLEASDEESCRQHLDEVLELVKGS